jgi:hypothetical protein
MKSIRSGWCETGFCSRCPELLQVANDRRREIRCDCPCHQQAIRQQLLVQ